MLTCPLDSEVSKQLNLTTYTTSSHSKELMAAAFPLPQQPHQEDGGTSVKEGEKQART